MLASLSPLLLLISGSLVAALPSLSIEKRQAGPSGYLIEPQGEADWYTQGSGDVGYPSAAQVIYQGVSEPYTEDGFSYVQTVGIDIYAQAPDLTGPTFTLATGLAPVSGVVNVSFLIPRASDFPADYSTSPATFRLVINETQFFTNPGPGQTLTFQSAAPLINYNVGMIP